MPKLSASFRIWRAFLIAIFALVADPAAAEKRVALVIGVDRYNNLADVFQLNRAVNDARAIAVALRDARFEVLQAENVTRLDFARTWQRLLNMLQAGDTAAIFFAGHGVEIGGLNYLMPGDIPRVAEREDKVLRDAAIRLNDLMDDLREKRVGVALLIIDACRENPFRDGRGRSIGGTRGLAPIEPARGSFVMYSAGAGESALDRLSESDDNPNSVFTRSLLPLLRTPNLSLPETATRVRRQVVALSQREQTPAYYDALLGDFFIMPDASGPNASATPSSRTSEAAAAWDRTKDTTSVAALELFIESYKDTYYAGLARLRIEELEKKVAIATSPAPPAAKCDGVETQVGSERRCLKPKDIFRDCTDCPEMVVVPAGQFTMGSPAGEEGRYDDEGPQHAVRIGRAFAVGRFAITRGEYAAFVRETNHPVGDKCWGMDNGKMDARSGRSFRNTGFSQDDRHPVVCVNWADAKAFAAWLSKLTGKAYRLLSDAEREYVTRAGSATQYTFGNDARGLCQYGNVRDQTWATAIRKGWTIAECNDGYANTAPVGQFAANAFGVHDVHGNVLDWTEDCWNANYQGAPTDGSAWTSGDCSKRVVRGGSWSGDPRSVRSARRIGDGTDFRHYVIGFRLARTLGP
jgi:formylglycine-generating enzyme required for sulfatase activity